MKKVILAIMGSMFILSGCGEPAQLDILNPQCDTVQKSVDESELNCEFN